MTVALPIYLDNHASTRCDPRVVEAMLPYYDAKYGNASSRSHKFGWDAEEALEDARAAIARLLGAQARTEIVFTSGGTEADNLAVKGVARALRDKGNHIITQKSEHKAVLDSCARLAREGFAVTLVDVDGEGRVNPDDIRRAITPETILISVMLCNNENGTVQPLRDVGRIARERDVVFHTDAVQGAGLVPFDVQAMNIDLASISAHKLYGPKGVGALYVRSGTSRVKLTAEMDGGGQERGLRGGSLNVPGIVGLGHACAILRDNAPAEAGHLRALRDRLHARIVASIERVHLNGAALAERHPGNLHVSFEDVDGEALLTSLKNVAVSSGAACTSASLEPSHVLKAMGMPRELAQGSIRFGVGRFNTEEEVDFAADEVAATVKRIRAVSASAALSAAGVDPASVKW